MHASLSSAKMVLFNAQVRCAAVAVVLALLAGSASGQREPIVACLPQSDCRDIFCVPTLPQNCPSRCTVRCGCCDVCVVHLDEGEQCRYFVPTNARCRPGLVCGSSGLCERPAVPFASARPQVALVQMDQSPQILPPQSRRCHHHRKPRPQLVRVEQSPVQIPEVFLPPPIQRNPPHRCPKQTVLVDQPIVRNPPRPRPQVCTRPIPQFVQIEQSPIEAPRPPRPPRVCDRCIKPVTKCTCTCEQS